MSSRETDTERMLQHALHEIAETERVMKEDIEEMAKQVSKQMWKTSAKRTSMPLVTRRWSATLYLSAILSS